MISLTIINTTICKRIGYLNLLKQKRKLEEMNIVHAVVGRNIKNVVENKKKQLTKNIVHAAISCKYES